MYIWTAIVEELILLFNDNGNSASTMARWWRESSVLFFSPLFPQRFISFCRPNEIFRIFKVDLSSIIFKVFSSLSLGNKSIFIAFLEIKSLNVPQTKLLFIEIFAILFHQISYSLKTSIKFLSPFSHSTKPFIRFQIRSQIQLKFSTRININFLMGSGSMRGGMT